MSTATARAIQRGLSLAWFGLVVMLVLLIGMAHLVPRTGQTLFIIRGGSMEPTIPVGTVIGVAPIDQNALQVGQIVTLRHGASSILTHRIVALETIDGEVHVRTQGDYNTAADPGDHAAVDVVGHVQWYLPLAGFVLAFLSAPAGMVSVISLLGAFLLGIWLLEDLRPGHTGRELTPRSASSEAPA